jgi:5-methylcytosine-specific restriction endonuclease McrA
MKRNRSPTGEAKLFYEIWSKRPHYCVNCKAYLGNEPRAHYFSHIKSKGAYPELRLDPNNIQLLCIQCHTLYDSGTIEQYKNRTR